MHYGLIKVKISSKFVFKICANIKYKLKNKHFYQKKKCYVLSNTSL